MALTSKQSEYLLRCDKRWCIKTGATGSGKSFVDFAVTIPKRVLAARGEGLLVMLGNTRGTLERNILEPMRELWPGCVGNIRSDNTVNVFGKKVYALGADNRKHVARIQGATFEWVYGDEVTTWSEDVFQMLKSRLRCEHSHFDGTCNPDSPNHWFKRFLDSDADIYHQHYTIEDGVLPPQFVEELKKEYAGTVYYARFIEGLWAQAEGLVYPMWESAVEDVYTGDAREWCLSVDYGTQNATAALLWAFDGLVWHAVKEYYYSGRTEGHQKTDDDYVADLAEMTRDVPGQLRCVVDPSAASFIAALRRCRERQFSVMKARNDVLDGIRETAVCMQRGVVKIGRGCENLIKELQGYVWDESADCDKPVKENDHSVDAARYAVATLRLKQRSDATYQRK